MKAPKRQRGDVRSPRIQRARILRKNPTPAERHTWELVRGRRLLGYKFRRQHPVGPHIVDFYCAELRLVLEIDGDYHYLADQRERDGMRSAYLQNRGMRVVRLHNALVCRAQLVELVTHAQSRVDSKPHPRSRSKLERDDSER